MARTRAVPRRRPNINFQQRGNIDFERQRVAATRNISSTESSTASSTASSAAASPAAASPARSPARSPLGSPPLRRRIRANDVKIKFVLPRVKNIEVKHNGRVVRRMVVRRIAKHAAKKRNVRYG